MTHRRRVPIQTAVDRRFNRSRYEADQVTETFATRLQQSLSSGQLSKEWIETVNTHFEPSSAGIWLNDETPTPAHSRQSRAPQPRARCADIRRMTQGRGVDIRDVYKSAGMGSVIGGRRLASGCPDLGVDV